MNQKLKQSNALGAWWPDLVSADSGMLANPLWGAPRIHGELLKLGIDVSQATVSKNMVKPEHRPSQSRQTFLTNHARRKILHLKRVLREYVDYYHRSRTHLGLEKGCPMSRPAPRHQRATFPETTLSCTRYELLGVESNRIDEPDS